MGIEFSDKIPPLKFVWECPKCGAQMGQAEQSDVVLHPPFCGLAHERTEMEQRSAERWMRQYEDDAS